MLHFWARVPTDQSSIHLHTLQVEQAKGRADRAINCDPLREHTCFASVFDGEFRGQLVLNHAVPGGQCDHCVLT